MSQTSNVIDYSSPAARGSAWTQTGALLMDAYRDLQSRKLFWLTLILSLLVALIFLAVGINESGITIFGKLFPAAFNTYLIPKPDFFKYMFTALAIPFWLGFLSAGLALVSVGGIFPDAVTSGSIDLYLSRPIGRLRLFLTKYLFGLLFTALQVLVFSTASFIVIGVRGGTWEFGIFLAIPLVTLFFSYLYCICALVGLVTRSTLASILITVIFWGMLYAIHNTDLILSRFAAAADVRVTQQQKLVALNKDIIDRNNALSQEKRGDASAFEFQLDRQQQTLSEYEVIAADLHWWHDLALDIKTPLPKTNETVDLMQRWLLRPGILSAVEDQRRQERDRQRQRFAGPTTQQRNRLGQFIDTSEVQDEVIEQYGARRVTWIIGSSVLFEAVVLGLAAWWFCTRDY